MIKETGDGLITEEGGRNIDEDIEDEIKDYETHLKYYTDKEFEEEIANDEGVLKET